MPYDLVVAVDAEVRLSPNFVAFLVSFVGATLIDHRHYKVDGPSSSRGQLSCRDICICIRHCTVWCRNSLCTVEVKSTFL
jgi:hypothetical protein